METKTGASKDSPLIDRTREMGLLKETVDKAISDQGQLFFLYGEAGIGKTRLAMELKTYAHSRGMRILYGRCPALFKMNGVFPYSPWKELVRDYIQTTTPEQLQRAVGYYPGEIYKIVPEIKQKLITFSESAQLSPETEQERLFEAVAQFFSNISKTAPLMLVLDDLQWADASSLLLLHYIARGIFRENILLLGAYRNTEVEEKHPLTPVLTELNRARLLHTIQLKRMSFDYVAEMIKQILGQNDVPKEFCQLVHEKTDGNPFFVEEVLASLKEDGLIVPEREKNKIMQVSEIEFPKTVKDVLKARLDRLNEECKSVLTTASYIGNDFTFEALREATGLEEGRMLELIDQILKTGLLKCRTQNGEDRCTFADALVRDVLYDEVNPLRRKKLHEVVGQALEEVYVKKLDEHFGELASHFLESGNKDKALNYFLKAGEKAEKVYAYNEAGSYFQSALRFLEENENNHQKRARVLETLGDIKRHLGDYDACLKLWNQALLFWSELGESQKVAQIRRKIGYILWVKTGNLEKAKNNFSKSQEILEAQPESAELANLYADIAEMHWRSMELDQASSYLQKAIALAKKVNAYETLSNSYMVLAKIACMNDRKKAAEYSEEALKVALDHGCLQAAVYAYLGLSSPNFGAEDPERRRQYVEEGYDLAKKVGLISGQINFGTFLAGVYFNRGEIDAALLQGEEAIAFCRRTGNLHLLPLALLGLGHKYIVLGEFDKAEAYLKEALVTAQKTNDVQAVANASMWLSTLLIEKGEYAKAIESSEKIFKQFEKAGAKGLQQYPANLIARAAIEMGDFEKAERYINSLEYLKTEVYTYYANKGKLLSAQKKWSESIENFEKALTIRPTTSDNLFYFAKRCIWDYAQTYVERNQEGDKQKAINLLNHALEILQKLHAKRDVKQVKAEITFLQTGRKVHPKHVSPVASGYSPLDKLLCGSLPPNSAIVLASPSCEERDNIVRNFLETGAKNGEPTFYVTIDPTLAVNLAEEFPSTTYMFVCNPQAETAIKPGSNIYLFKGVENLTNISIAITSSIRKLDPHKNKTRRLCANLVSDILLQHGPVQTRKWLTELLTQLRAAGFTTLSVVDPQMHSPEQLHAVLGLFDGEINIREAETDQGSTRFLRIKRLSGEKFLKEEVILLDEY